MIMYQNREKLTLFLTHSNVFNRCWEITRAIAGRNSGKSQKMRFWTHSTKEIWPFTNLLYNKNFTKIPNRLATSWIRKKSDLNRLSAHYRLKSKSPKYALSLFVSVRVENFGFSAVWLPLPKTPYYGVYGVRFIRVLQFSLLGCFKKHPNHPKHPKETPLALKCSKNIRVFASRVFENLWLIRCFHLWPISGFSLTTVS